MAAATQTAKLVLQESLHPGIYRRKWGGYSTPRGWIAVCSPNDMINARPAGPQWVVVPEARLVELPPKLCVCYFHHLNTKFWQERPTGKLFGFLTRLT